MTHAEIVDLMSLAALYDQRTGGESDVYGWHVVAQLKGWTMQVARRVVVEHYACGADRPRITPAAITDGIHAARRKAADSFTAPDVPEQISAWDYPAWYRAQLDTHIARVLDEWVAGRPIPESCAALEHQQRAALTGPDTTTCPNELRDQITRDLARAGRERRPPAPRPVALRPCRLLDPNRREHAYAELDAIRQAPAAQETESCTGGGAQC